MNERQLQDIETRLFVEALALRHGYDFRHYARASLHRRVRSLADVMGCNRVGELIPRVLHDADFLGETLSHLSVPVTEMFRDPQVFLSLRRNVLPLLASFARISVWIAGCATGEEAVSVAILLKEEGLLSRAQIYATDINDVAMARAEEGIYSLESFAVWAKNHQAAGGKGELQDHFVAAGGYAKVNDDIRAHISHAHHNLAHDAVFAEVSLVLCRNVMIYFDRQLQDRALGLFYGALTRGGFLCIGTQESMSSFRDAANFRAIDAQARIFKKTV